MTSDRPKLSVIGTGYLGATHAVCMVELGYDVIGLDVDEAKIESLRNGHIPFYEPGLPELLTKHAQSGRLRFTTDFAEVAEFADVHFVCVGTPQRKGELAADMTYVEAAFSSLAPHLTRRALVVGKSTVPAGTAARMEKLLKSLAPNKEVELAWNPEFLREGFAVKDTLTPDRLVFGVQSEWSEQQLRAAFAPVIETGTPVVITDFATAELVKVAANAFLATKISFINAMAEIAEVTGADVTQLADAIGYDNRIGRRFLGAGVGFGGGCLPKDIRAFTARAEELGRGESVAFLKEVDSINLRRRQRAIDLTVTALGGSAYNAKVAVLGLSFKPHSDDVRDSPALDVAVQLHGLGANVVATDPQGIENSRARHPQLTYSTDLEETLRDADAVVLVTEWPEFRHLDPAWVGELVKNKIVIDGRNSFDAAAWRAAGWTYHGLGRP